jgi:four helix bundle protein
MFEVLITFMATINRFEDLEIWQLAFNQTKDFDLLIETTPLAKDYELRNQMNSSSGSVMDCIAEGFERSGNSEFKKYACNCKRFKWRI